MHDTRKSYIFVNTDRKWAHTLLRPLGKRESLVNYASSPPDPKMASSWTTPDRLGDSVPVKCVSIHDYFNLPGFRRSGGDASNWRGGGEQTFEMSLLLRRVTMLRARESKYKRTRKVLTQAKGTCFLELYFLSWEVALQYFYNKVLVRPFYGTTSQLAVIV